METTQPQRPAATVVNEKGRKYVYGRPDCDLVLSNVIDVSVSVSGKHYVRYKPHDKIMLAIVAPGWQAIVIDPGDKQDWTF